MPPARLDPIDIGRRVAVVRATVCERQRMPTEIVTISDMHLRRPDAQHDGTDALALDRDKKFPFPALCARSLNYFNYSLRASKFFSFTFIVLF